MDRRRVAESSGQRRTFVRYVLFQIPGWILAAAVLAWVWPSTGYPPATAMLLGAAWVLKDFALYPLVRSAYEGRARTGGERLIGTFGTARDRLDPDGYVLVAGELWRARAEEGCIDAGSAITVVAADGLALVVTSAVPAS